MMLIQWLGVYCEFDDNMLFSFYCRVLIVVVEYDVVVKGSRGRNRQKRNIEK